MKNWSQLPLGNNTLPIFPIAFFPNIEYFSKLKFFDKICIEGMETFPKQTYRNRAYVLSANGVLSINVPTVKQKHKQLTSEVKISYVDNWNIKAWRTITSAYGRSPYFEYYSQDLEKFFLNKYDNLIDLNIEVLFYFKKKLKIETEILKTDNYYKSGELDNDFRGAFLVNKFSSYKSKEYFQCFSDKHGFAPNLSILDLIFNLGPEAKDYI